MLRKLAVAVSLANLLFLTTLAHGGALIPFAGQNSLQFPAPGVPAGDVHIAAYSVQSALSRYVFVGNEYEPKIFRIDPYGVVDRVINPPITADEIYVSLDGTIFANAWGDGYIFRFASDGTSTTVIGTGTTSCMSSAACGDGGDASLASVGEPIGFTMDAAGNFYFADADNCVVRRIDRVSNIVTLVAGNYSCGLSGDGGQATSASLNQPEKIVFDPSGVLYIADRRNHCVRKVDLNGVISTFAGICGTQGSGADNVSATQSLFSWPSGVDVDQWGNVFISEDGHDGYPARVRQVSPNGIIKTLAGGGLLGTLLNAPRVSADPDGNLFVSEYYASPSIVRKYVFTPSIEGISPTSGPVGTKVIVKGKYFGGIKTTSGIKLGALTIPANNIVHWSNTEIHLTIPSGAKSGNFSVVTLGGTSNLSAKFSVR